MYYIQYKEGTVSHQVLGKYISLSTAQMAQTGCHRNV